jgi:hypothetical protein
MKIRRYKAKVTMDVFFTVYDEEENYEEKDWMIAATDILENRDASIAYETAVYHDLQQSEE